MSSISKRQRILITFLRILWNPKNKNQFASFGKNLVQFYKINDGSQAAPASWIDLAQKLEDTFKTHAAAWNPRSDEIALGRGTSLHGIDIRNPSK